MRPFIPHLRNEETRSVCGPGLTEGNGMGKGSFEFENDDVSAPAAEIRRAFGRGPSAPSAVRPSLPLCDMRGDYGDGRED